MFMPSNSMLQKRRIITENSRYTGKSAATNLPASASSIKEPRIMTAPKTLLQMSGAPLEPNRLSQSALIIIDAQNDYRQRLPLTGFEAAVSRLQDLLARARAARSPVFHIVHKGPSGGLFDIDTAGGAIIPELAPRDDESVIVKTAPNGFSGTSLLNALRAMGQEQLIVAGFMTHMCVSTTVRDALDFDFRTTVVADATATRALPGAVGGSEISAQTVHRVALSALADRFAIITSAVSLPD